MTYKPVHHPEHQYFITATVLGWRYLFHEPGYAAIILDSLAWHRRHGRWALYAYVVMPNHVHALVQPGDGRTISEALQSFGSYTAHAILGKLRLEGREKMLAFFRAGAQRDADRSHRVWRPIQAANVESEAFLIQKLEYIHDNPVAGRWRLTASRADYPHSSACYYDRGEAPAVEIDDVWRLLG